MKSRNWNLESNLDFFLNCDVGRWFMHLIILPRCTRSVLFAQYSFSKQIFSQYAAVNKGSILYCTRCDTLKHQTHYNLNFHNNITVVVDLISRGHLNPTKKYVFIPNAHICRKFFGSIFRHETYKFNLNYWTIIWIIIRIFLQLTRIIYSFY